MTSENKIKKKTLLHRIYALFLNLYAVTIAVFSILLIANHILPTSYRMVGIGVLILLWGMLAFMYVKGRHSKAVSVIGILLLIGLTAMTGLASKYIYSATKTIKTISEPKPAMEVQMSVVVPADSAWRAVGELSGKTVNAPREADKENIEKLLTTLKSDGIELTMAENATYMEGAKALLDKEAQALILNESYRVVVEELYPEFATQTRVLSTSLVEETEKTTEAVEPVQSKDAFNVYISGIDSAGPINVVSRSDVNIIATVNPETKTILLTSAPRDSYVRIAGGGQGQLDKLTHAGIYGVNSSIKTLENLLDQTINYYVRVNFTAFERIINTVGGVQLNNPEAFSTNGGVYFPAGEISMDGAKALTYVRERYNVRDGATGRERNQERVIEAVFNKLIRPESIIHFQELLTSIEGNMDTNMSQTKMMDLVNRQIENPGSWDFRKEILAGSGKMGLNSFAMPGYNLYMHVLDQGALQQSIQKINEVLQGR